MSNRPLEPTGNVMISSPKRLTVLMSSTAWKGDSLNSNLPDTFKANLPEKLELKD